MANGAIAAVLIMALFSLSIVEGTKYGQIFVLLSTVDLMEFESHVENNKKNIRALWGCSACLRTILYCIYNICSDYVLVYGREAAKLYD